jgi:adenosylhomocysteine nucleosidase
MVEEIAVIKKELTIEEAETIGQRKYYTGKFDNVNTVLVFSGWGKVASSSTVTTLINKYDIDFVIFTGVAGAVDAQLNIGDIVIASSLYQHDMDARPIFERFQIPLTKTIFFKPRRQDVENTKIASQNFLKNNRYNFSNLKPTVYVGCIASGDQFISEYRAYDGLKIQDQKVLAVEMEGAAVAQVCEDHNIPYIIVRTISDKADHSASINFQDFVKNIASYYSNGIVRELYKLCFCNHST